MKNGIYIETFSLCLNCEVYYKNNEIYCVKYPNGDKIWYKSSPYDISEISLELIKSNIGIKDLPLKYMYHREDGPAVEFFNGYKQWWINNKLINVKSQEEFEKHLLLQVFE